MYSDISLALAQERVRDMRNEADQAFRSRRLRRARRAGHEGSSGRAVRFWRSRPAPAAEQALPIVVVPDSYEDFLCQTAQSAMNEPTAAGRAYGQTVR
jgi:hypothetical protein